MFVSILIDGDVRHVDRLLELADPLRLKSVMLVGVICDLRREQAVARAQAARAEDVLAGHAPVPARTIHDEHQRSRRATSSTMSQGLDASVGAVTADRSA